MNLSFSPIPAGASLAGLVVIAAFNSWISRINQFFFFSRSADPAFAATSTARKITSDYLKQVWLGFFASALVLAATVLFTPLSMIACVSLALVIECICCCTAFARAHRLAGVALATRGPLEQNDDSPHATAVAVPLLGPAAFTRSLLVMLALAPVFIGAAWFISMSAAHMGFNAFTSAVAANRADFLSGLGVGLLAASILVYVQLRYFSRHRSPMARFTASGCVQLAWLGAATTAFSAISVPLHIVITKELKTILLTVVFGIALLRFVYGWAKARMFAPPVVERSGDQFWRWGLFYYNPSDPTLFIQHRSGPGYTVNFAKSSSWLLTLLFLGDLVFLVCIHLHR